MPRCFRRAIGVGKNEEVVSDIGTADPHLFAVEDVGVPIMLCGRADTGDIATRTRLCQPKRSQFLATRLWEQDNPVSAPRFPTETTPAS